MSLLIRLAVNTLAIMATAYVLPKVTVTDWKAAVIAAILLGLLNTLVRPVFRFFALPITILTLGLFTLVINGFVLKILDWLMDGLTIEGVILWHIVAALLISIITTVVNIILGQDDKKKEKRRSRR
ncbi:MAG: phage holin family protein [Actinobacteria bacterium]|nr:phage holin family protein [Actinomycetota bacterium]